jgi:stearoyl-CoA desaturase (delta-9 desaturase)
VPSAVANIRDGHPGSKPGHESINWTITSVMILFHIGALAALTAFSWRAFLISIVLYWISTGLGISLGYHRLLTHRSYKTSLFIEYFFAICGALTLEGGPISWVGTHRVHHQKADRDGDPHSPRDGGWWAHAGWVLRGAGNHNDTFLMSKYAPDLARDRFYRWLNSYHWVPLVILTAIIFAAGGLGLVLWGICFRVVFGLHATWLVNSATHMWGARRFATGDDSRNNWWVALLTFGEGWHNNHHAFPTSARHGLAWYQFDPSWMLLKALERVGLAEAIKLPHVTSRAMRERKLAS